MDKASAFGARGMKFESGVALSIRSSSLHGGSVKNLRFWLPGRTGAPKTDVFDHTGLALGARAWTPAASKIFVFGSPGTPGLRKRTFLTIRAWRAELEPGPARRQRQKSSFSAPRAHRGSENGRFSPFGLGAGSSSLGAGSIKNLRFRLPGRTEAPKTDVFDHSGFALGA